jgi:hypothetical protein
VRRIGPFGGRYCGESSPEPWLALRFADISARGERELRARVRFVRRGVHFIGETARELRFA